MSTTPMMGGQPPAGGNPMLGYGNAGGQFGDPMSLYQGYGWNPQMTPMNWGGPYGPMSWPSWNQQSMNAQGLYGAMFNPWLMLQQGQAPAGGNSTIAPTQSTPMPAASGGGASPHFAVRSGFGTPTEFSSPQYDIRSLADRAFRMYQRPSEQYQHNAALGRGMPGVTQTAMSLADRALYPGPQPVG